MGDGLGSGPTEMIRDEAPMRLIRPIKLESDDN